MIVHQFIDYIRSVRRYSERTADIYESVLKNFYADRQVSDDADDQKYLEVLNVSEISP